MVKKNPKSRTIEIYDLDMNYLKSYNSIVEASKNLKVGINTILCILKGKTKRPRKYYFKYKEENYANRR